MANETNKQRNKQIANTVHILTSGKVLLHSLYADDKQTNKQIDVEYTEYIQNETLRLSFNNMGITSWNQMCSESELPL